MARFFLKLAPRRIERVFARFKRASRDFPQALAQGRTVIVKQADGAAVDERQNGHGTGVQNNVAHHSMAIGVGHALHSHLDAPAHMNDFARHSHISGENNPPEGIL